MNSSTVIDIFYAAMTVAFKIAVPLLLTSMAVGLLISVFQAATQINEQTLTFVPKLLALGVLLLILSPWIMATMMDFVYHMFSLMLELV